MSISGGQGAITSDQNVVILAVFSEAISGLTTSNFLVSSLVQRLPILPFLTWGKYPQSNTSQLRIVE
jgi:hypothetical protein